jgi:CubicO group peptidase (beta-lactamase class C family)
VRRLLLSAVCVTGLLATGCRDSAPVADPTVLPPLPAGADDLHGMLEDVRARHGLPGIAAAVFNADGLRAVGAAGTRKIGSGVPLLFTDRLSIASIAKTMTATIVARLIDRRNLAWESSLQDIYPELTTTMRPEWRGVTVEQLLRHRAGLPRWMSHDDVLKSWVREYPAASNRERRDEAVKYILSRPPDHPPGIRYAYTNDAYLVLGSICERVTGRSYEMLLRDELVGPLEMTSVGFEEPWSDRSLNQPWGHVRQRGRFVPFDPDPAGYGGVPFGTPYGAGVNASVIDLARYGMFHLRGDLGVESGLTSASFRRLHHAAPVDVGPATQVAAAGFFNEGRVDADGRWTNVQHWGYYARGRTLLWFSPQANVGAVVLTNGTDEDEATGMRPISEIAIALFQRYRARP